MSSKRKLKCASCGGDYELDAAEYTAALDRDDYLSAYNCHNCCVKIALDAMKTSKPMSSLEFAFHQWFSWRKLLIYALLGLVCLVVIIVLKASYTLPGSD